ncbi:hypothetical protein B0H65DRAFT_463541 [Neurospora tetraspora]|uniref:Ecp2 effector protein-like domain-containing protein n=1 Tax=Neurospora tetraspora TaxID=94610 RepID=A0AAE0JJQ1_9PEZI|nr:hypothetical protein B0H65DRAFT_463541 [Neurospora tetraspora]
MHSLAQLALIGLASAAVISPVSRGTTSGISVDDNFKTRDSANSSSDLDWNQSLNFTSTTSSDGDLIAKRRTDSGTYTSITPPAKQPDFCPYDLVEQPQPLLSYDNKAPLASDCGHIVDLINDTKRRGSWTFDIADLEKGIILINYKSCAFKMVKDGEISGGKKIEQFKWGVEELKFYLGTWLQKQRHGRLGSVGSVNCWVEGERKKDEGGVRVKWMVQQQFEKSGKALVYVA